jgi:hypothetical protein
MGRFYFTHCPKCIKKSLLKSKKNCFLDLNIPYKLLSLSLTRLKLRKEELIDFLYLLTGQVRTALKTTNQIFQQIHFKVN